MLTKNKKLHWILINLLVYTLSALASSIVNCYFGSFCISEGKIGFLDIVLFPLTVVVCWAFTWCLICAFLRLEYKQGDKLNGFKAVISYIVALICGYFYPFMLIGG